VCNENGPGRCFQRQKPEGMVVTVSVIIVLIILRVLHLSINLRDGGEEERQRCGTSSKT
jgi:hypothetical protein